MGEGKRIAEEYCNGTGKTSEGGKMSTWFKPSNGVTKFRILPTLSPKQFQFPESVLGNYDAWNEPILRKFRATDRLLIVTAHRTDEWKWNDTGLNATWSIHDRYYDKAAAAAREAELRLTVLNDE